MLHKGISDSAHSGYMSHSVGQASCSYYLNHGDLSPLQPFLVSSCNLFFSPESAVCTGVCGDENWVLTLKN